MPRWAAYKSAPLNSVRLMPCALGVTMSLLGAAAVAVPGAVAGEAAESVPWAVAAAAEMRIDVLELRLPKDKRVSFSGIADYDAAGGRPGFMLYPAPDPITAVAGLVTHATILGYQKRHEKSQIRATADGVLAPYTGVLENFSNEDLMRQGLDVLDIKGSKRLLAEAEHEVPGVLIDCVPAFFMTQDGRALVLENSIRIRRIDAPPATSGGVVKQAAPAVTATTVKIVGSPLPDTDSNVEAYWMTDGGDALRTASVNLFRDSLKLALENMQAAAPASAADFHTIRYREGGSEKMERAAVIFTMQSRLVLKNLRGWILSVPVLQPAALPSMTP